MAEYFSHDYGSRNDPKLVALQMEMGHEGKGIFWDLVEIMYEQGGYITVSELKGIAFALHTQYERITDVLTKYDLFQNDGEKYWSNSVISRLNMRAEKSEKARKSVLKRWNNKDKDTNVLRTQYEGNTKKESKVKESKENKEILCKEREAKFLDEVKGFSEIYSLDMLNAFFAYWSQWDLNRNKMRFEKEKTWETNKRLVTWKNRS